MTPSCHLAIVFLLGQAISAGAPERALSEYHKREWQVEDGLPHGNVRALAQDENGALLIGTGSGLATFDGLRFTPMKVDDKDEFANEPVNAILRTRKGDLFIGTDGRGIIHRDLKGHVVNVSETAGLYQERVRALFEDSDGVVWAATQNGVERIIDDRVEYLSALGIVPGDITTPFALDGSGGVFLITVKGLFHWMKGVAKPFPIAHLGKGEPTAVLRDGRGSVWVGTIRGAVRLDQVAGTWNARAMEGIHGPVAAMAADSHENIWFGTRGEGLCRIALSHPAAVSHWSNANGLADDRIRSLFEDSEGNLWIGLLSGGLNRWRQTELIPYGKPEGLPDSFAATVLQDRFQDVWLGTWGQGLFRQHHGQLEPIRLPGVPLSSPIRALAEDPKGGVWIGTWFDGLYLYDHGRIEKFVTGHESPSNAVSALVIDHSGALWVGTYSGLLKYEHGRPARDQAQVLLGGKVITSLKETAPGRLLVGTTQGLYILEQSFVTALTRKNGLSNDYVISISADDAGGVWITTKAGGVDRLVSNSLVHIPSESGLPAYPISSVLDDGKGTLWMGSTRGVLRVSRDQLHAVSEGRAKNVEYTLLGRADGMRASECGSLSQPPASRGIDGSLWFATAKGFVHTNPTDAEPSRAMPRMRASMIGFSIGPQQYPPGRLLSIPPGPRDVDIQFSAVRLSGPSQVQFRYKLDGYDPDWTVTQSRHATYRQLPPGNFRFQVAVKNANSDWSTGDEIASAELEQLPYFHQRWWFYAFLVAIAAGATALLIRSKIAHSRERVAAVIEERNRIARDWHDTLMADFAAISWQLEATRYRLESGSPREASSSLEVTRNMVKHCQAEARRIIWDLRNMDEPMGLLSQELGKVLSLMGPSAEQGTEVHIEGEERPLPPVFVHHLVCIGQEAVSNALRHGSPKTVHIHLNYTTGKVSLAVEDDGHGFPLSADPVQNSSTGHFGLAVMQERARKIGGQLKIRSTPGTGTEVRVEITS